MSDLIFVVGAKSIELGQARVCLEQSGYSVRTFSRLGELSESSQGLWPSLMLITAALPDGSGLDLCKQIRRNGGRPGTALIVMTEGTSEDQSCAALEAGADNVLASPFTDRELLARVQAALRQCAHLSSSTLADIVIDHSAMKLSVRGDDVVTTSLEFRLMNYLARHRGQVLTRDVLLDAVWGDTHFVTPRTVDACIRRIREKIEPDVTSPTYLKTVRGLGYRFDGVAVWPSSAAFCGCAVCSPSDQKADRVTSPRLSKTKADRGPRALALRRTGIPPDSSQLRG